MTEPRTMYDPFLGKDVEISNRLVDRLRGRYASGPMMPNGEPEFGWQEYPTSPIAHEAAAEIERLELDITNYQLVLSEARKVLRPFASSLSISIQANEAAAAAATFLNKIGWGKE